MLENGHLGEREKERECVCVIAFSWGGNTMFLSCLGGTYLVSTLMLHTLC